MFPFIALAPGAAWASSGCDAVNAQGLNVSTTYSGGTYTNSGGPGVFDAGDGGGNTLNGYAWSTGDTLNVTITASGTAEGTVGYKIG
jgi:hypothetical protein